VHCNLKPPEPRQSFPALLTMTCLWSHWTYPLPYYSVFAADTLLYPVTWPLTLKICSVSPVTWSVPQIIWTHQAIRNWVIAISVFYLNFCTRYVTLWPWLLTRWPWKFFLHQASRGQSLYKIWTKSFKQSPAELLIILLIFAHDISRCDLDLLTLNFESLRVSCI